MGYLCVWKRRLLFQGSSLLTHVEGKGPGAFVHKRSPAPALVGRQATCSSYFIEPVQWMEPALLGVMEGPVRDANRHTFVFRKWPGLFLRVIGD